MATADTETVVPVADPSALMASFVEHIRQEHGMEFDDIGEGAKALETGGLRIEFAPQAQGLAVKLRAPQPEILIFFKEEVANHVAERDAQAASKIRWSNETATVGALPDNFKVLTVVRSRTLFDGLLRVTLTSDSMGAFAGGGIHVRLMMPLIRGRRPLWPRMGENGAPIWPDGEDKLHARTVTISAVRLDVSELDIDIAHHSGGLISDWAAHAAAGDTVGIMGPAGSTPIEPRRGLFFAADLTGLSTVARLIGELEGGAEGDVVVAFPPGEDLT
ncbi:MAG: siderophore-interacting protein, partial [Pseudomonadota bacterium]